MITLVISLLISIIKRLLKMKNRWYKRIYTNDFNLTANEIIEHYNNQYDVERAFRI